jgi:DNA ligase-1
MKNIFIEVRMEDLIKVIELFNKIEQTSSRTNKNNQLFRDILNFAFNSFIVTGISKKKISKIIEYPSFTLQIDNVNILMDYLKANNTGSDHDIATMQMFIRKNENIKDFLIKLITKDFSIGITADSINKAFNENFIPVFDCMLAQPFERFYSEIACEIKIDGTRCITIKQGNSVNMFSRNGKLLEGFDDIIAQVKSLPIPSVVLDGELYGKDYIDTMNKLFRKASGKQANYMIFDMITLEEFQKGISDTDYWTRKEALKNLIPHNQQYPNLIRIDPFKIINNATVADIDEATQYAMSMGFEGAMIKPLDGLYECKRSYTWQKSKVFSSDEFPIIGFEEGEGKYKGTLGKVIIDVNGVAVGVGSGWTDSDRYNIWDDRERYLGKIIEVKYQEKTKDNSLRFPTAKSFRLDK